MPTVRLIEPKSTHFKSVDSVRSYLREIGRVPLLTHEQELIYGKQVQTLMVALDRKAALAEQLGYEPSLDELAEDLSITSQQLKRDLDLGQRAKKKMIESNLRLVVSIAKKYQKRNLDFLDLIQEGSLGLERGVEKFDPSKGYKFSTYAYWWIRQAITRAIAQQSRSIRLPIHITEKLNKIKKAQRELSQELGRNATTREIAQALELEPDQIRTYLAISRQPMSLDMKVGDNQDTELQDLLEDDGTSPDRDVTQQMMKEDLLNLLDYLTPQQQEVIHLRFGLGDGQTLSLAKIGKQMNLSRERVRQLEKQALMQLRRRRNVLQEYVVAS
ncbi:MAG: RNA polymerase sigma factor, RpoD/SigA family [Synechococcaceae cyanobacterium RL_1_2]|nr:RNA polymerase sigma factor, RpoD/SigA family [Synechococcaceae cyanobacterium RL_1_2]